MTTTSADRTAFVLGATGGVGGEITAALLRHGWRVIAAVRDPSQARSNVRAEHHSVKWVRADAMDRASVLQASEGADCVVHAVNPPGYRNWGKLVLPMIDNTIAAAEAHGARILLPGTIYNYGPDAFPLLTEDAPQRPITQKGKIRVQLEQRLERASGRGVRSLIVRAGDFFGPFPGNNWFSQGLVKPGEPLKAITNPAKPGVGHAWAYLPDLGETFARLMDRESELDSFARFHFAGHWDQDGQQIVEAIRRVLNDPSIKTKSMPWGLLTVIGLFNETLRELVKMKYLWDAPVQLSNRRLVEFLGEEPHTPLDQAIAATLAALDVTSAK